MLLRLFQNSRNIVPLITSDKASLAFHYPNYVVITINYNIDFFDTKYYHFNNKICALQVSFMITAIQSMTSIGKYKNLIEPIVLHKNQIIFGFNGTGKSTISDLFYSLCYEEYTDRIKGRKTLPSESGEESPEMSAVFTTTNGNIEYSNGVWNQRSNLHVFNEQYIGDNLFVGKMNSHGEAEVIIGREATKLSNENEELRSVNEEAVQIINEILVNNKDLCDKSGIKKTKITDSNIDKRLSTLAELCLFSETQKESIRIQIENKPLEDERIKKIQKWINDLNYFLRYPNKEDLTKAKNLEKILKEIPKVTNKEIATHISKYMSRFDVGWLSQGVNYQSDSDHCPFCGQEIQNVNHIKLVRQINKFIQSKQKQKADEIKSKLLNASSFFEVETILSCLNTVRVICEANDEEKILHSPTIKLLKKMIPSEVVDEIAIKSVKAKIEEKYLNPYEVVSLDTSEKNICTIVCNIGLYLSKITTALVDEKQKLENKITSEKEIEKKSALYEMSFGENRDRFTELVIKAKTAQKNRAKIRENEEKIKGMLEDVRIESINRILQELNVNFSIKHINQKYQVQIMGFSPVEYCKENKDICSEGERHILAFAYFLQEIKNASSPKTVVIDDPISSLDMNRKSIVAFKISELMNNTDDDQIIVLSHDISFVEKLCSLIKSDVTDVDCLELRKSEAMAVAPLVLSEYLLTDEQVYEKIIKDAETSNNYNDKLLGLMAIRPYVYIKTGMNVYDESYKLIEKRSTYFAHTIYSQTKRVSWNSRHYSLKGLRAYCKKASQKTKLNIDENLIIPEDFVFSGFNYDQVLNLYTSIGSDNIFELRKKAIVFRVLLEATLYMLVFKKKFDPERIGGEYLKAIKGAKKENKTMCECIKELYDLSKKFHHGADASSTLGISNLNPDEMLFYDREIKRVTTWISNNPDKCNPNASK